MGYYVNAIGMGGKGKVEFMQLGMGAIVVPKPTRFPGLQFNGLNGEPSTLVCVIDNGPFEAAAVIYSESELSYFSDPSESRPMTWLAVPVQQIRQFCPDLKSFYDQ